MSEVSVVVHSEPQVLAQAVAARLAIRLLDAQAERGEASVVLTGGRVAAEVYRALGRSPAREAVDWSHVDIWWGDERFLPAGDPDRNETQARAALLDALPLDPTRVHPMPASDGPDGADPEAAAARYAAELAAAAAPATPRCPTSTCCCWASARTATSPRCSRSTRWRTRPARWPRCGAARSRRRYGPRSRCRRSTPPKRCGWWPPARDKAGAVGMALTGAGPVQVPAAGVHGVNRTLWLLDRGGRRRGLPQVPQPALTAHADQARAPRPATAAHDRVDLGHMAVSRSPRVRFAHCSAWVA